MEEGHRSMDYDFDRDRVQRWLDTVSSLKSIGHYLFQFLSDIS